MKFVDRLWAEYPIPKKFSIWYDGEQTTASASLVDLLETCVDELKSDILIDEQAYATGMNTVLPEDCKVVNGARLAYPFQGNQHVKVTYNHGNHTASLRYFPAYIFYKRLLTLDDLHKLEGDQLQYAKAYILWKMAEKEYQQLTIVKLNTDNAEIDMEQLQKYGEMKKAYYEEMKKEILIYSTAN